MADPKKVEMIKETAKKGYLNRVADPVKKGVIRSKERQGYHDLSPRSKKRKNDRGTELRRKKRADKLARENEGQLRLVGFGAGVDIGKVKTGKSNSTMTRMTVLVEVADMVETTVPEIPQVAGSSSWAGMLVVDKEEDEGEDNEGEHAVGDEGEDGEGDGTERDPFVVE